MIVLTGATGHVGGEAARILTDSGVPIRILTRNPARVAQFRGAEVVGADYDDPETIAAALQPGDHLFMVPIDATHDERMAGHVRFLDVVRSRDPGLLVYLSFINAAPDATFEHARSHGETEQLIRDSGLPFVFLRMGLYQSTVPNLYLDGVCSGPAGDGKVGWVAQSDIGAAVAAAVRDRRLAGSTFELTGPEGLGLAETTDRINRLLDLRLRYVDEAPSDRMSLRGLPDPQSFRATRISCLESIASGEQATVSDDLERLTRLRAAPFERHVVLYPEQFTVGSTGRSAA